MIELGIGPAVVSEGQGLTGGFFIGGQCNARSEQALVDGTLCRGAHEACRAVEGDCLKPGAALQTLWVIAREHEKYECRFRGEIPPGMTYAVLDYSVTSVESRGLALVKTKHDATTGDDTLVNYGGGVHP
jgi:hypothetical protein